jgi:hydroxyacylglutathione hydrolase
MFTRHFEKDSVIFEEGAPGLEFYIILSGAVAISKSISGNDRVLAVLKTGNFFGEMAILDGFPRSARAVAVEQGTTLMAVDAARFIYLVSQQPAFAMLIMEAMSKRQRIREEPSMAEMVPAVVSPCSKPMDVIPVGEGCIQLKSHTRSCNAYLFRGPKANVLIDTALPSGAGALTAALATVGMTPATIDLIILTHEHFDHTAAVPSFKSTATVASHPLAANKIHLHDEFATLEHAFGERHTAFSVDACLDDGLVIETGIHRLRVIFTPGHSSGGLSLFDEHTRLLVSGDTVFKGGQIGGVFGSGNISDLIYSLRRLRATGATHLLAGHGPMSSDPVSDIDRTLGRCEMLLDDSRRMFDAMQGNENVNLIINAYKDLNRKYMR